LVKILDFGLAKAKSEKADDSELTATGQMMGTPDYAAPEQSLDAKHVDIRADVYSLGCTLFYLLTGRPPYSGRTVFEVMKAHHMTPTPDVRVSRPDVPEDLAAVIRQMMAKTPAERFQTPAEAAEALEPFLKPSTEQPKRRSGASRAVPLDLGAAKTAPETRRPERTRGFRKVLLTVVVVDVVLLLGLAAWWAGVFKQKNPDAMLVVDVDQANPEVLVDGDVVPTVWEPGGKRGELRLSPGKHTVQVKKEGFVVYQEEVDLEAEGRGKLTARLERSLSTNVIEPPPSIDLDLESDVRMELLHIPAGKFVMGSPPTEKERSKDEWQHEVTLTKDFYLGKFEVTRAQFGRFVADEDYKTEAERDDKGGEGYDEKSGKVFFGKQYSWRHTGFIQGDAHPVVNVTWNDATAFCKWLTRKTGRAARLPTEAEWEYACRGGSQTVYNRGSRVAVLEQIANVGDEAFRIKYKDAASTQSWDDGYPFTAPGGKFKSNKFGLYDMHGNVREWCADWYGSYPNDAVTDPEGPTDGSTRVIRGGGFFSVPRECRSAARVSREPTARHPGTGFRVAMPAR
jgi:formylglycine-generating enzyme required for sulfatase activity